MPLGPRHLALPLVVLAAWPTIAAAQRPDDAALAAAIKAGLKETRQAPAASARAQPAQPAGPPRWQAGIGFLVGVPIGDFAQGVDVSPGFVAYGDFALGRSVFSLGGEFTALTYGGVRRMVPLSGIPNLSVPVETSNEMYLLHGRFRVQGRARRVRPYVDGLVGFIDLVTTTTVDAEDVCYTSGSADFCTNSGDSITNLNDLALSLGGGAGVMFGLGKSPHFVKLDVSVRYLYGGEMDYLTEGFIPFEAALPQTRRSRTDMVAVSVGVAFGR